MTLSTNQRLFIEAIRTNDVATLNTLGVDPNFDISDDSNPVVLAAMQPNAVELLSVLKNHGANLNRELGNGYTPLTLATSEQREDMLLNLLQAGANPNTLDRHKMAALHYAASLGHTGTISILELKGADINLPNADGNTPLFFAAHNKQEDATSLLLQRGAYFFTPEWRENPLMQAAFYSSDTFNTVLKTSARVEGFDINAHDSNRRPVVDYAAALGSKEMVEALIARGVNTQYRSQNGKTFLMALARGNQKDLFMTFLRDEPENSAYIHHHDELGDTALHKAATYGDKDMVEALIKRGLDPIQCNRRGRNAFMCASGNTTEGGLGILQYLYELGDVDLEQQSRYSRETPFLIAAEARATRHLTYLQRLGANIHAMDVWGKNAITANLGVRKESVNSAWQRLKCMLDLGVTPAYHGTDKDGYDRQYCALTRFIEKFPYHDTYGYELAQRLLHYPGDTYYTDPYATTGHGYHALECTDIATRKPWFMDPDTYIQVHIIDNRHYTDEQKETFEAQFRAIHAQLARIHKEEQQWEAAKPALQHVSRFKGGLFNRVENVHAEEGEAPQVATSKRRRVEDIAAKFMGIPNVDIFEEEGLVDKLASKRVLKLHHALSRALFTPGLCDPFSFTRVDKAQMCERMIEEDHWAVTGEQPLITKPPTHTLGLTTPQMRRGAIIAGFLTPTVPEGAARV